MLPKIFNTKKYERNSYIGWNETALYLQESWSFHFKILFLSMP